MNQQEKIYRTLNSSGLTGIIVGVAVIVTSVAAGVMMIISGARLLVRKSEVMI